jgi:hypothetical protein
VNDYTLKTSYNAEFHAPDPRNIQILNASEKRHAFSKLLHQSRSTGITSRELAQSGKLQDGTSYRFDYRDMSSFSPSKPHPLPEPVSPKEKRALKYRQWVVG